MNRKNTKKRLSIWNVGAVIIFLLFLAFFIYPIVNLLWSAFMSEGSFSLAGFEKFFNKNYYYSSTILNSLKVSASVMIISLLLGIPFSYFYTQPFCERHRRGYETVRYRGSLLSAILKL